MMGLQMLNLHGIGYCFGIMSRIGGMIMFGLLIIAFVVVAIVWMSKNSNRGNYGGEVQPPHTTDRSLEILNERYALGEIDDEEYTKKKLELKKNGL